MIISFHILDLAVLFLKDHKIEGQFAIHKKKYELNLKERKL